MIHPHVVNFHCERWQTAGGKIMTAPLPAGITGHFGPELRRFVLAQYHQAQVTMPRLLALLRGFGVIISKRQIVRLLIAGQEAFLDEARDVLRAGLSSATTAVLSLPACVGEAWGKHQGGLPTIVG